MGESTASGYAPVNGVEMYWESFGAGRSPTLVAVHGGYGLISTMAPLIDILAMEHRVIGIEIQGHGHTADIDRPFSYEAFGDDIAALIEHLDLRASRPVGVLPRRLFLPAGCNPASRARAQARRGIRPVQTGRLVS